jgi:hypothetical protein
MSFSKRFLYKSTVSKLSLFVFLLILPVLIGLQQQQQTIKSQAAGTQLSFTVFLHGIGKGGDSANAGAQGNMNPVNKQRVISVGVFNPQNALVMTKALTVTYSSTNGNYTGSADFGTLPSGPYTVTVRADKYLQRAVSGIQTITSGQSRQIPPVTLIAGDMFVDNKINIQDYNLLMNCYSDLTPAKSCTIQQKALTDLTDDGAVNQLDYNLFIREISNRIGEGNPTAIPTQIPTQPQAPTPTVGIISPTITQQPTVPSTSQIPAQVLNLSNWKLTLPSGSSGSPTEIKQPALASYKNDPFFLVSGGGVKFRSPVNGVTTSGSSYPRSELREMSNNGSSNASWSNSSGTHTMTIEQAIMATPKTKKHVVAGQIHDASDDVIVIRLEGTKLFVDIGGTDGPTLDANYTLGKKFTVKFEATGGKTNIYYNGSTTPAHTLSKSYSGAYFKAGAYTQSNCSTDPGDCSANNYGEVIIYSLQVSHN